MKPIENTEEINSELREYIKSYKILEEEIKENLSFVEYLNFIDGRRFLINEEGNLKDDEDDLEEEDGDDWTCEHCEKEFILSEEIENEIEKSKGKDVECPNCHELTHCEYEDDSINYGYSESDYDEKEEEEKANKIANHIEFKKYIKNEATRTLFVRKKFPEFSKGLYPWQLNRLTKLAKAIYDTEVSE